MNKRRPGLGRRKACDLCHTRKIKCDATEPKCTHCTFYNKECTYTPLNKRKEKQKRINRPNINLNSIRDKLEASEDLGNLFLQSHVNLAPSEIGPFTNSLQAIPHIKEFPLPPLDTILPLLDVYFSDFNPFLPLFNQVRFMRSVRNWYDNSVDHDSATWATINIVLALALQQCRHASDLKRNKDLQNYVSNAQSAMNELATRACDFKGIQVILGLVIIFQGVQDSRPSSVLTATAVKLAHRLRLNSSEAETGLSMADVAERRRIFWIVYVIDRDMSIRGREPYFQRDEDFDIELPPHNLAEDEDSELLAPSCPEAVGFLRCRAQLAHIQGKVYDYSYSIQAQRLTESERLAKRLKIDIMLREWNEQLPQNLSPAQFLSASTPEAVRRHIIMLHFSRFQISLKAHGIYGHDMDWIQSLVEYSIQFSAEGLDENLDKNNIQRTLSLSKLSNLQEKVTLSTLGMTMFRYVDLRDSALIWNLSCVYLSSLTVLIAAKLTYFGRGIGIDHVIQERESLIKEGLKYISDMAIHHEHLGLSMLYKACSELNRRADIAQLQIFGSASTFLEDPWVSVFNTEDSRVETLSSIPSLEVIRGLSGVDKSSILI